MVASLPRMVVLDVFGSVSMTLRLKQYGHWGWIIKGETGTGASMSRKQFFTLHAIPVTIDLCSIYM